MTPGILPAVDDHAWHDHGLLCADDAPFAAFGNYFLPIQVGAEDMPFPRFNMMSFWVTFLAFVVLMSSFFVARRTDSGGWTQYAPLNSVGKVAGPGQGLGVILWMISIAIFCVGQLLGSLNFITTTLDLRVKGMSLMRCHSPPGRGSSPHAWG